MLIALHVLVLTIGTIFFTSRLSIQDRLYFRIGVTLKILSGILVGALYFFYYGEGDTVYFFHDAKFLSDQAAENWSEYVRFLWYSEDTHPYWTSLTYFDLRSNFFVKFSSVIAFITTENYWLISAYMSLFSFLGSWYFYRKISLFFPQASFSAFIALFIFPTVLFWTSGFIKESIANAALMYACGLFLGVWMEKRIRIHQLIGVFLSLWLLWSIKYHYMALLIPVMLTSLLFKVFVQRYIIDRIWLQYVLWVAIFIAPILLVTLVHPNFRIDRVMEVVVANYQAFQNVSAPEDMIHFYNLQPEVGSFLINAPVALWSGLFRPTLLDAVHWLHFFAALENLLLLGLTVVAFKNFRLLFQTPERILLWSLVVYVTLLCIGVTLAAPNFGTLSRYRTGYLPFFILLITLKNPAVHYFKRAWRRLVPSA